MAVNILGNPFLDHPVLLFAVLFRLTLTVLESGYRIALQTKVNLDDDRHAQIVSLRDALGILLSLLLGFTFAMAVSRFDKRQELVVRKQMRLGQRICEQLSRASLAPATFATSCDAM